MENRQRDNQAQQFSRYSTNQPILEEDYIPNMSSNVKDAPAFNDTSIYSNMEAAGH